MSTTAAKRGRVVVPLTNPFTLFRKQITEIVINEPTGALYGRLGEPRTLIYNQTGAGYYVDQMETVLAYLDKLIDHETSGETIFSLLSLEDAKAVKDALLDFFTAAEARIVARKSTPSSSARPA